MTNKKIIEIIVAALPSAAASYLQISGVSLWEMPESWVQCKLAEALHDHGPFRVVVERPVTELHNMPNSERLRDGKIDLAVYEKFPSEDDHRLDPRALIELKCARSSWGSVGADAIRIQEILSRDPDIDFGMIVYVSGEMKWSSVEADREKMLKCAGLGIGDEILIGPHECSWEDTLCWFCQVLIFRRADLYADLQPLPNRMP